MPVRLDPPIQHSASAADGDGCWPYDFAGGFISRRQCEFHEQDWIGYGVDRVTLFDFGSSKLSKRSVEAAVVQPGLSTADRPLSAAIWRRSAELPERAGRLFVTTFSRIEGNCLRTTGLLEVSDRCWRWGIALDWSQDPSIDGTSTSQWSNELAIFNCTNMGWWCSALRGRWYVLWVVQQQCISPWWAEVEEGAEFRPVCILVVSCRLGRSNATAAADHSNKWCGW